MKELHKGTLECPFVLKDSLAAVIFHPVPCWGKKNGNCSCTVSPRIPPFCWRCLLTSEQLLEWIFGDRNWRLRIWVNDAIKYRTGSRQTWGFRFSFLPSGRIIATELTLNITRSIRKQKQQVSSPKADQTLRLLRDNTSVTAGAGLLSPSDCFTN